MKLFAVHFLPFLFPLLLVPCPSSFVTFHFSDYRQNNNNLYQEDQSILE